MNGLRLVHSGPGIPGALRSHVKLRPPATGPYDHQAEQDSEALPLALSLLVSNGEKSTSVAVQDAARLVRAAAREGFLVALRPSQRVVDVRHPSMDADPTPPYGTPRRGA